ncbi:MAG: sulfite exporter TauE/SafE family protein [Bdellovibrionales bacterium]|nr:sulfite exporter TauE/SafE family protein [Bdellovibrionales bacterium]
MIFLTGLVLGLFVAAISVFIGLGGGILLVPLLPSLFNVTVHESVATSVATIFLVVSLNTYRFHKEGWVKWQIVKYMGPTSAVTAIVAAQLAQIVESRWILIALVILLSLVGLKTLLSSFLAKSYQVKEGFSFADRLWFALGGGLAGLTSGFAGVGSGVILSPMMILLRAVKPSQLSPTSNANMVFTTGAAAASFLYSGRYHGGWQWGLVRFDIALLVFISAAFFAHFLRPLQHRLPFFAKSLLLSLLLLFLVVKILLNLFA